MDIDFQQVRLTLETNGLPFANAIDDAEAPEFDTTSFNFDDIANALGFGKSAARGFINAFKDKEDLPILDSWYSNVEHLEGKKVFAKLNPKKFGEKVAQLLKEEREREEEAKEKERERVRKQKQKELEAQSSKRSGNSTAPKKDGHKRRKDYSSDEHEDKRARQERNKKDRGKSGDEDEDVERRSGKTRDYMEYPEDSD